MKKLKVLWVAPYPYERAIEDCDAKFVHAAPWITSLADEIKSKVDLTILSFSRSIKDTTLFKKNGISFVFLRIPKPLHEFYLLFKGTIRAVKKFSRKNDFTQFDIIHIHGTEHQYASGLLKVSVPKVISIQGLLHKSVPYNKEFNFNFFSWRFLKKYEISEIHNNQNFICRTHWDKNAILKFNKGAKIYENWELLRPEFYVDAFDINSYSLLHIGGLVKLKGINESLKSFKLLHRNDPKFRLIICGYGNDVMLQKLLKKHQMTHLKSFISFEGKKNAKELVEIFSKSFCLLHPSYIDNSPNSVCEAQVAGLPVIASDVGGVSSLIDNKESGILVNRYSYIEIANWVEKLKLNKDLYLKISKQGKFIARKRHSKKEIVDKTIMIYNSILNKN